MKNLSFALPHGALCRNARRYSRRAALKASGDKDVGDSYRCRVGDRIFDIQVGTARRIMIKGYDI